MHDNFLINYLSIGIGAVLGVNLRFLIISRFWLSINRKEIKVLIINTFSSFLLGFSMAFIISETSQNYSQFYKLFLVGFIGSLSTFSSFIYELFKLSLKKKFKDLIYLIIFSILLSLVFFYLGYLISLI